jgi:hypothetical protein
MYNEVFCCSSREIEAAQVIKCLELANGEQEEGRQQQQQQWQDVD